MAVLCVDLATRRWSDLGIVVLERALPALSLNQLLVAAGPGFPLKPLFASGSDLPQGPIACEIIPWSDPGLVEAEILAGRLNHLCAARGEDGDEVNWAKQQLAFVRRYWP